MIRSKVTIILAMMKFLLTTFSGVKKSSVTAEPSTIQFSLSNGSKATIRSTPPVLANSTPSFCFTIFSIAALTSLLSSLPA